MTLSTEGMCLRDTLAYVATPAGHVFVDNVSTSYSVGAGFGYLGSAPFALDQNTAVPAIAGYHNFTTRQHRLRQDKPNGKYKIRLGMGQPAAATASFNVWDGACPAITANTFEYAASASVTASFYTVYGANLYQAGAGGTTGASSPPVHTSGTVADGSVSWTFVKTAIYSINQASASGICDAAGNRFAGAGTVAYTGWDAGNAEAAPTLTITQGYITVTAGQVLGSLIRYVGLSPVAEPLQDLTLSDEDGLDLGVTPTIYAMQPPGKLLHRINAKAGLSAPGNFAITGTLAPYLTVSDHNGEAWVAASSTRMPDNASGTYGVQQTDASSTITGSPRTTTITPTIVSSQGRPANPTAPLTTVFGLIPTEDWLNYSEIKTLADACPQGFTGQALYTPAVQVASAAAAQAQITTFAAQAGNGRWFAIELMNGAAGAWTDGVAFPACDFLANGTGGLIIRPAAGQSPMLDGSWNSGGNVVRGIQFTGLTWTGSNHPSFSNGINFYIATWPVATSLSAVWIDNCQFYAKGWVRNAARDTFSAVTATTMDFLFVRNCDFLGCAKHVDAYDCHVFVAFGNRARQGSDDFFGWSVSGAVRGAYAGGNTHSLIYDNSFYDPIDYLPASINEGNIPHKDFGQGRLLTSYGPKGTSNTAGQWIATIGQYLAYSVGWYQVVAVTGDAKVSGTKPTHQSGDVADGNVTWRYLGTFEASPMHKMAMYNNRIESSAIGYVDDPNAAGGPRRLYDFIQFIIQSQDMPLRHSVFGNICSTSAQRGYVAEISTAVSRASLWYNSFMPPLHTPPAPGFADGSFGLQQIIGAGGAGTNYGAAAKKIRAGFNIASLVDASVAFDENNMLVGFRPETSAGQLVSAKARGSFVKNSDNYTVAASFDASTMNKEAFDSELSKLFHPNLTRHGGRALEYYTLTGVRVNDNNGLMSNAATYLLPIQP